MFGVGGGIVMVPAMTILLGMPIKTAMGTSLAVIVPTALAGTLKYSTAHHVQWSLFVPMALLAIPGGYLGAWLTTQVPADLLKRAFGGLMILVGVRLLMWR